MGFDLRQNIVSAQYLNIQLIDKISPNFIYAFILTRSSSELLHFFLHFLHICATVMALDFRQNFVSAHYLENKLADFHQIFICIHIDRSSLGLMHVIFQTFVPELWPLIYPKISFPFNTLRTKGQHFTKLYITINTDKIYAIIFLQICKRVMALD